MMVDEGDNLRAIQTITLINLDRSVDRLREFQETNTHIRLIARFPAVDGAEIDRTRLQQQGYISNDCDYGNGTLGSAMSHIRLWEKVVLEKKPITIFEDAVVVSHSFYEKTSMVLRMLPPDWDFIQWGSGFPSAFIWVDAGIAKARLHPYGSRYQGREGLREYQSKSFDHFPIRIAHSFGIMGYSITPSGAEKALKICLPLRKRNITFPEAGVTTPDVCIDIVLAGFFNQLKAYCCIPPLVVRSDYQASIRGGMDNEQ